MSNSNVKSDFFRGLKDGIPIALGYIPIAMACGIAVNKAGIPFLLSQLLETLVYSGAGQIATVNLFQAGETAVVMYALTMLITNCRYMVFSMSLSQRLDPSMGTFKRILIGALNTDEVFGVVVREKGYIEFWYYLGVATISFIAYALGNVLGTFAPNLIPESVSSVLGIIIYGMLIALIVPPAKESKSVLAVVLMALGMSIILECIPAVKANLSAGWIIIICALVTATIGAILFPVEEKEESVE